jgi:cytochrome c oxidase subunit 2
VDAVKRLSVRAMGLLTMVLFSGLCFAAPPPYPQQPTEIKVTARKFEFIPKKITVRRGEPVRLVVTSEDVNHGIAIEGLNIDKAVKARATEVIEFTPAQEGKFRIFCSVFCGDGHPDMEGELVVTAAARQADSDLKADFVEAEPGVVIVSWHGERVRIDTANKTVTRIDEPAAAPGEQAAPPTRERESSRAYEPYDYRLVNVPTPKRVRKGSLNVHFTHRFTEPINDEGAEDLFGLDGFSVSSFGLAYGITDRLYASFYRSPINQGPLFKTIEVGLGYHLLDEAGRSPIALSAYASVEGEDNFTEEYTYNIQAMVARSVTRYVNLFFSPAVHINSNGQGRFNPRAEDFGVPDDVARALELGQHTGSFGFGVNARIRPTTSLVFEYTPRVGFKLGNVTPVFDDVTNQIVGFENDNEAEIGFGVEKRIGRHAFTLTFSNTQTTTTSRYNSSNFALPPSKFIIGFNLFRRLF